MEGYRLTVITNMYLSSKILHDEGDEIASLQMYKEFNNQFDSLIGLNQVQSMTSLLMRNLMDKNVQERLSINRKEHYIYYILLAVIIILGIATVYYFRDSLAMLKEKYHLLTQLNEQSFQLSSCSELKQHLSIVIFEYKKGLDDCMQQLRNSGGKPEDYQNLNRQMDETNDFVDQLKKWMEEQPYHSNLSSCFDAGKYAGVIVRMLQIIFHSKQITVQNHIGDNVIVYGSRIYFSIALEIALFRLMKDSQTNAVIRLSVHKNHDFVTFILASSNYVISEELNATLLVLLQKLQTNPKTVLPLQTRLEIFLKCIYENNGKMWFENNTEEGTILNFTLPKGRTEK
jgi:light-regulated signal transduction histidine kinase (bacteriophytochrome)